MSKRTITKKELAKLTKKGKRRKYRNQPQDYNDVRYASIAEADRAAELDRLVKAGDIMFWLGQPTIRLGCGLNVYRSDFLVIPHPGDFDLEGLVPWFEDVKGGTWTEKFRHNVRLWMRYGPAELRVITKGVTVARIFPDAWPEASTFPDGRVIE